MIHSGRLGGYIADMCILGSTQRVPLSPNTPAALATWPDIPPVQFHAFGLSVSPRSLPFHCMVSREGGLGGSLDLSMDSFIKRWGRTRAAWSFREPGSENGCWEKEEGWGNERGDAPKGNSMALPICSKLDGQLFLQFPTSPHSRQTGGFIAQ